MMKYSIVAVLFVFQTVFPMEIELTDYFKQSPSIQDTEKKRKPLLKKLPADRKPVGHKIDVSLLRLDQIGTFFARVPESWFA